MLKLQNIKENFSAEEKVVNVKAWGGEVKIRPLTIAERNEVIATMQKDGAQEKVGLADFIAAQIKTAHFALVDPKISEEELKALPERAFEGVKEICDEVEKLNAKK